MLPEIPEGHNYRKSYSRKFRKSKIIENHAPGNSGRAKFYKIILPEIPEG
jgi:hypothetical protein